MKTLAKIYLQRKGYVVRKAPRKPKVGDTITFITGGNWEHTDSYITQAVVKEMGKTLKTEDKPFIKYGYLCVGVRDKRGKLIHAGMVHPKEVLENKGKQ